MPLRRKDLLKGKERGNNLVRRKDNNRTIFRNTEKGDFKMVGSREARRGEERENKLLD